MVGKKKFPAGITQLASGWYAVRPYDRVAQKKGRQHTFATLGVGRQQIGVQIAVLKSHSTIIGPSVDTQD